MTQKNVDIRDVCFEAVYKIIKKDNNVVFLSDDMDAYKKQKIKNEFPKQYINVGVAEQNLMDLAAGLAACGKKVFVYGICSYITGRCYEQIKFSIGSMNLPVVIIGVGAGFSFPFDGPTHHGTQDFAIMRTIPEMAILNPCDSISCSESVKFAHRSEMPVYVRLDKGVFPQVYKSSDNFKNGFKIIKPLKDINIFSTGYMTHQAINVYKNLKKMNRGIGIVDIFKLKPLNEDIIWKLIKKSKKIAVLEENTKIGGFGSAVSELALRNNFWGKIISIASQDKQFLDYGTRDFLLKKNNLDLESISKNILQL